MEKLIHSEIYKNASALFKLANHLSPSYQDSMKMALSEFDKKGLPSKKDEDWKYTSITKNISPRFFDGVESIVHEIPEYVLDKRAVLIFNNGIFNKFLSILPDGFELDSPPIQNQFHDSFDALNFATSLSPMAFKLKKNCSLNFPVSIIHLTDDVGVNKIISPKITITAEENTQASFFEFFTSTNNKILQYTTNNSTSFILKDNANIEHVKVQNEADHSTHIGLTDATLFTHSHFQSMTIDFGQLMSRHNINIKLNQKGSVAFVHGLFSLNKNNHADIFSNIYHNAAETTSDQLFKGILAGNSHGIFTGKIVVALDAQRSSSSQLNKNLMLSKTAHIDSRPQLLVHADDVKCSHGATIGQLSEDEAFYLESRGINKDKAKKMLCAGFATDVLLKIKNKSISEYVEKLFIEHFESTQLQE